MDRPLLTGPRRTWDVDAQIDSLLACHPRLPLDPERAWAIGARAEAHGGVRSLASRLVAPFIAAADVLARAGRPGELGWADLAEPTTADRPALTAGRDRVRADSGDSMGDELDDDWPDDADAA